MREENLSYFEEPDFKRALEKYEKALENNSSVYLDADELTDIAEYYMTKGQENQANEAIQLALDLHPESVDPQIFLSRQQMFYGNMKRAHEICDGILDQNDREVHFLRAELMICGFSFQTARAISCLRAENEARSICGFLSEAE